MLRFEPKVRWWSATTRSLSRFAPGPGVPTPGGG